MINNWFKYYSTLSSGLIGKCLNAISKNIILVYVTFNHTFLSRTVRTIISLVGILHYVSFNGIISIVLTIYIIAFCMVLRLCISHLWCMDQL